MRYITTSIILSLVYIASHAQVACKSINKVSDGVYLMYLDSTINKRYITKSTIVEFRNSIGIIELPISWGGGSTKVIKDYSGEGQDIITFLHKQFPNKKIEYLFTTHWHPHSISSAKPFLEAGVKIVTTAKNYDRFKEMIDSVTQTKYHKQIIFVDHDSIIFGDKTKHITAYKLDKPYFPHLPTEDYLFFYIRENNLLHVSCMFQRLGDGTYKVKNKEMISSRVEDLKKLIDEKNLSINNFISGDIFWDDPNGLISIDTLNSMYRSGITMGQLESEILAFDTEALNRNIDSITKYILANKIPSSILNNSVYTCISKKDIARALALARIQCLVNPSDPNAWDTYGEVYYFMGNTVMAKKYEMVSKKIDSTFSGGGEKNWAKEYEYYKEKWKSLK